MNITREDVIKWGLDYLNEAGTGAICAVCISNGGSCCHGCPHIKSRVGCQKRNTSCTSWLCGYLMLIFHDVGLLFEWNEFWSQVPGKDFRKDNTPAEFPIEKWIDKQNLRLLTTAFSEDLMEISQKNKRYGYVVKLNDILYRMITLEYDLKLNGDRSFSILNKRLARLMKDFRRYNAIKAVYSNRINIQKEG